MRGGPAGPLGAAALPCHAHADGPPWPSNPRLVCPPPLCSLTFVFSLLLCRYGDPKTCSDKQDALFAQRFQHDCSLTFLQAALAQLATLSQVGGWVGARVRS